MDKIEEGKAMSAEPLVRGAEGHHDGNGC
jgi:hypothetical protein